jgi:hypothetical protein
MDLNTFFQKLVQSKVYDWMKYTGFKYMKYGLIGNCLDDIMILEQAERHMRKCQPNGDSADTLNYDWFIEFVNNNRLQDLLAKTCLQCDSKKNDFKIQLRFHTSLCQNKAQSSTEVEVDKNNNIVKSHGKKRRLEDEDKVGDESSNKKIKSEAIITVLPSTSSQMQKRNGKGRPRIKVEKEKAPCDLCGRFFEKNIGLIYHRSICQTLAEKEKAPCDICGLIFDKQIGLPFHRSSCQNKPLIKKKQKQRDEVNGSQNSPDSWLTFFRNFERE